MFTMVSINLPFKRGSVVFCVAGTQSTGTYWARTLIGINIVHERQYHTLVCTYIRYPEDEKVTVGIKIVILVCLGVGYEEFCVPDI
jgi:hypothetical protein